MTATRWWRAHGVAVVLLVGAAGCGFGQPDGSAPPTTAPPEPVHLVVLGGDASVEGDIEQRHPVAWPRVLFRDHLPAQTTYVDVARAGATAADAARDQVPLALAAEPTLAIVWLVDEDVEAGTPVDEYAATLGEVVVALQGAGARVFVTSGFEVAGGPYAAAVVAVAVDTGADVVDLGSIEPGADDVDERIADAFAAVIG